MAETEQLPAASSSPRQGEFWGDCLSPIGPYTRRWPTREAVQSEPSCPLVQEPSRGGWEWKPSLKRNVATQQAPDPSVGISQRGHLSRTRTRHPTGWQSCCGQAPWLQDLQTSLRLCQSALVRAGSLSSCVCPQGALSKLGILSPLHTGSWHSVSPGLSPRAVSTGKGRG